MRSAVILLSTHNGERFLPGQLDSIVAQSWVHWRLIIRDDASTDRTTEILTEFSDRDPRIELRLENERLGPARSFGRLLETCPSADFYFWCDQDDVWPRDRLERMTGAFEKLQADAGLSAPALLHSDLRLIDSDGHRIEDSLHRQFGVRHVAKDPLGCLIPQNFVFGCASMFNDALRSVACPVPREAISHDWWLALTAGALGRIHYMGESLIDYRRHSGNVSQLGRMTQSSDVASIRKTDGSIRRRLVRRFEQSVALQARLAERAPDCEALDRLRDWNEAWARGGFPAVRAARRHRIRLQRFLRTSFFLLQLLLCRPPGSG